MSEEHRLNEQEQERRRLIRLELKRKQQKRQRITLVALAAVLALIIVLICRGCAGRRSAIRTEQDRNAANEALQAEVQSGISATITAVGDIMCYDEQIDAALQEDGTYDFSGSFAAIRPYLEVSNLTLGNLELNFCGAEKGYTGKPKFNAPESLAAALKDAGFDVLQTANTYSIQNGIGGLYSTIDYLTQNGIAPLGTYKSANDRNDSKGVLIRELNGIRFAFIGYTKGLNNMALPDDAGFAADVLYKDYYTFYTEINEEAILRSIKAAKDQKADVIVAMLHWGNEYELEPSTTQKEIADLMVNNGVDVILGSHSHEVGPMELRKVTVDGEEKDVFIAYSLGNFFSAMTGDTVQPSVVLDLRFTMDVETGDVRLSDVSYLPTYITDSGEHASVRYEVLPIRSAMETSTFSHMKEPFQNAIRLLKANTNSNFDSGK